MTFPDTLHLAARNLRQARLRTGLTTLGVAIGIASLAGMVSLGVGLQEQFVGRFLRSGVFDAITVTALRPEFAGGPLGARPPGGRDATSGGRSAKPRAKLDDEALGRLAAVARVREVYPNLRIPVELRFGEVTELAAAAAVPLSSRGEGVFQNIPHGEFFAEGASDACLISLELARRLNERAPGELIGKELALGYAAAARPSAPPAATETPGALALERRATRCRIVGIVEREPGPSFGGGFAPVMLPLPTVERLGAVEIGGPQALLEQGGPGRRSYTSATVRVRRPQDAEEVQKLIREMGFQTFSIHDALTGARRAFIILDILLGLTGSIALAVASLGIVNTMVMSILERTREIGIMKAIGGGDADIRGIFLVEASIIGLAGGVAGIVLGWGVGRAVNFGANVYIRSQGGPTGDLFAIPWWLAAGAVAFAVGISLLAGSYPAARAANLDPIRALRHD